MIPRVHRHRAIVAAACILLGGCSTLPQAGPVGRSIVRGGERGQFDLVEVDNANVLPKPAAAADYQPLPPGSALAPDAIAAGDAISVIYYEVGARLFSGAVGVPGTTFDPTAKAERIGPVEVDPSGMVRLPYTGMLRAAGRTPVELARDIEKSLRGKSENPQVVVRLESANGSSVIVGGEIASPGRVRLSGARERLLDVIALAGGGRGTRADLLVQIERRGLISTVPLDGLTTANIGGMPLEPGDRIELLRQIRSYSVLGSAAKVNQYDLPLRTFSLVEALALAGGPSETVADPAAVFVFRIEPGADGAARPVVYHFDMLKPASYFYGQQFYLSNKDVIYIAGAEANQPAKLLQIIGQIFTPIVIARQITNTN